MPEWSKKGLKINNRGKSKGLYMSLVFLALEGDSKRIILPMSEGKCQKKTLLPLEC